MAELTLKTRLLNKMSEGSVANLLKGEINFYPAGDFLVMEVGGTDKPFAALASDVYAWAKEAKKPTYTAKEIEGLDTFIAGEIKDTNTEYSIEESNGQIIVKTKDGTNDEAPWKQVGEPIDIITPTELNTILADYVTSTSLVEELSKYLTLASFNEFKEANKAAIADAKAAGTAANNALEAYKTANDAALAGVKATAEAAAVATEVDAAIEEIEGVIAGVKTTADAAAVKTEVEASIAEVKATADAAAVATEVEATVAEINGRIDGVKATADAAAVATEVEATVAEINGRIDTINDNIDTLTETVNNHYDEINGAIEELEAADEVLEGKITDEATARAEADAALAADIVAAEAAAKAYADVIKGDLLGNSEALEGTYDTLKEIHGWITKEGVDTTDLASAIADETTAREAADAALEKADSDLAAAIAKEAEDRAAEDLILDGKISTEATTRAEADADLAADIEAEATARAEADTALDGKITAEEAARIQGDADTLAAAKAYTDEEIVKVKAYADQAEADAVAAAATDASTKADAALEAAKAYAEAYANGLEHKDTTYTAGAGLKLDGTVFSIDTDLVFILDANA